MSHGDNRCSNNGNRDPGMLLSVPGPNSPASPGEDALSFNIISTGNKAERALRKTQS